MMLSLFAAALATVANVTVDFTHEVGPVRAVNGVGQPPLIGFDNFDKFSYLKDAGIPFSRLHDVGGAYGKNIFVDIPNLFRDFDADENDPKNYDFAFTDLLLKALVENGVEPYFRLGVTIENACNVKAYRIFPPKDPAKWARICEHVVAHYTEGWADGFRYKIRYWEIMNEVDNNIENQNPGRPFRNLNWWGTFDEYLPVYAAAAKRLKARFPNIRIGGYASCGFYATTKPKETWRAWGSDVGHYLVCFEKFLAFVKNRQLPFDFFSFHSYGDVPTTAKHIAYARRRLDEAGFAKTELHLNEWLPHHAQANIGTAFQAADVAAMLVAMQAGGIDVGCIYDAKWGIGDYAPLFDPVAGKPHKAYYSFVAFNRLRELGRSVSATAENDVYVSAATDGKGRGAVLLVNLNAKEGRKLTLDLKGGRATSARIIDATRTYEACGIPSELPPSSVVLLETEKENDK